MAFNHPIAYFLTWMCYGGRLHGDQRGSVDSAHNRYGTPQRDPDPVLEQHRRERMSDVPLLLDAKMRGCVLRVLNQHAEYRGWRLYAINIRTNHVHVVVSANTFPGRMMGEFKAYASRHLREQGLIGKRKRVWVEGGSKKHLFNIKDVEEACEYVIHGQGPDLPVE